MLVCDGCGCQALFKDRASIHAIDLALIRADGSAHPPKPLGDYCSTCSDALRGSPVVSRLVRAWLRFGHESCKRRPLQRVGDMSPDVRLQVILEDDGYVLVSVLENCIGKTVQFCTQYGVGRSPSTAAALRVLVGAMSIDGNELDKGPRAAAD